MCPTLLNTLSAYPTNHLFLGEKRSRLRLTIRMYLVQLLRFTGLVLTQFRTSSGLVKESPIKIITWNPILRTYRIPILSIVGK